jgi:hypothetical protein
MRGSAAIGTSRSRFVGVPNGPERSQSWRTSPTRSAATRSHAPQDHPGRARAARRRALRTPAGLRSRARVAAPDATTCRRWRPTLGRRSLLAGEVWTAAEIKVPHRTMTTSRRTVVLLDAPRSGYPRAVRGEGWQIWLGALGRWRSHGCGGPGQSPQKARLPAAPQGGTQLALRVNARNARGL